MIRPLTICSLAFFTSLNVGANSLETQAPDLSKQKLQQEIQFSKAISKQLAGRLKQRLIKAVQTGGLAGGIEQCQIAAPQISRELREQHPTKLISAGRTSLKIRNPNNQASAWQKIKLESFDQDNSDGLKSSYRYRIVQQDGRDAMEFISPIPSQGLCLNCHGEQLNTEVLETLNKLYPNDQARNYKLGDIRGAFVIRSWLDDETRHEQ